MSIDIVNPFVNHDLVIPERYHEQVQKYTTTFSGEGGKKDIDRSPFPRYIDIWWAAMGVGVREGVISKINKPHKFITGSILSGNPWRIIHLQMLALSHSDNVDILRDKTEIINIANGYAATGLPIIIEILSKKLDPIWEISNYFRDLCDNKAE